MRPARTFFLSFVQLALAGCSAIDPEAGAPQAACGISSGGESQGGPGASYYGASSAQTLGGPTCAASAGNACEDCESTHCCALRSACYGDPVCACADLALDQCFDAAQMSAVADRPGQLSRCWSSFAARGTVEQARVSCQRSWCQAACGVP